MAQFSAVGKAAAGDASFPFGGLYATAAVAPIIREIKVFNVGTAAARIRIVRLTTAGTWTALTENEFNEQLGAPAATGVQSAITAAPTIQAGDIDIGGVGAAAGSGFVYTYYGEGKGLYIPQGTGNGIGLIEVADTANTYDFTIIWEE